MQHGFIGAVVCYVYIKQRFARTHKVCKSYNAVLCRLFCSCDGRNNVFCEIYKLQLYKPMGLRIAEAYIKYQGQYLYAVDNTQYRDLYPDVCNGGMYAACAAHEFKSKASAAHADRIDVCIKSSGAAVVYVYQAKRRAVV